MNNLLKTGLKVGGFAVGGYGLTWLTGLVFASRLSATVEPKLKNFSLKEIDLRLAVKMINPTPIAFKFGKPTITVSLNGNRFAYSNPSPLTTPIPARGTGLLDDIKLEMGADDKLRLGAELTKLIFSGGPLLLKIETRIWFKAMSVFHYSKTISTELDLKSFVKLF